ncbi:MAG TPA: hypothetical protein VLT35_05875 [Methanocella sp.]|nr:hypothetical protein [Methanocella sp.]
MKTQYLLAACLSLILGSVFVAPRAVGLGLSQGIAVDLSCALLLLGMIAAFLAISSESRPTDE